PGWALHLISPTKYLTTSPAQSQESRQYTSDTSSFPTAEKHSNDGHFTSGTLWAMLRTNYAVGFGESRKAVLMFFKSVPTTAQANCGHCTAMRDAEEGRWNTRWWEARNSTRPLRSGP